MAKNITPNQADKKSQEIKEALTLAGGKLEDLSPEQLNHIAATLHGENFPENSAEAEILRKLRAFAEKKFAELNQEENRLDTSNLTKEDAPWIKANFEKLSTLAAQDEILTKVPDIKAQQAIRNFYTNLKISASETGETIEQQSMFDQMMELAVNETIAELSITRGFSSLSTEEQQTVFLHTFANNAQKGQMNVIQAEYVRKLQEVVQGRRFEDLNEAEKALYLQITEEMGVALEMYTSGKAGAASFHVSSDVCTSVLCVSSQRLEAYGEEVYNKTGFKGLWDRVKNFDRKMAEKHPKTWKMAKNAALSGAVGFATGGAGLAVLSAIRARSAVLKSYHGFKEETGKKGVGSFFGYLRKNPKEAISLGSTILASGVSVYFAGAEFAAGGLENVGGVLGKLTTVGEGSSLGFQLPSGFSGEGFMKGVQKSIMTPKTFTRSMIGLGTGFSQAGVSMVALAKAKTPEERAAIKKDIRAQILGSVAGVGIGSALSGFIGATHDAQADASVDHSSDETHSTEDTKTPEKDEKISHQPVPKTTPAAQPAPTLVAGEYDIDTSPPQEYQDTDGYEIDTDYSDEEYGVDLSSYNEDEQALYYELENRFGNSSSPEMAARYSEVVFNKYMEHMDSGDINGADQVLQRAHNNLEEYESIISKERANTVDSDDSKGLIKAKIESRTDTKAYEEAITKEALARENLEAVQHLPEGDPKRLQAEKAHADAYKDSIQARQNMAEADVDRYEHQLKDDIKDIKGELKDIERTEKRLEKVNSELSKLGYKPNQAPEEVGQYKPDIKEAKDYVKTADKNLKIHDKITKLVTEKDVLETKRGSDELVAERTANLRVSLAEQQKDLEALYKGDISKIPGWESKDAYEASNLNKIDDRIAEARARLATRNQAPSSESLSKDEAMGTKRETSIKTQQNQPKRGSNSF